ncbi:hypothetical protein [Pseudomonas sp. NPDC007930]|uniref:hypothetical protein n=1 Tax=Pseudomonas sp. NPDC007930 TaxID=3364417 RepID=UPI0036E8C033
MTVLIALSIIALMLSPLAWLKPSRRQSGRIAARLEARRLGLAMQLMPQPWPHWMQPTPPEPCPQYALPRPAGARQWCYWQPSPGQWVNQWREPCEDETLLQALTSLPADVWKVEAQGQLIAAYWGERGEAAQVNAALRALNVA